MATERILITVRTYPNVSKTYTETVCTGGIREDGVWRRLYPVQLRYLESEKQYRTWDIVTVRVQDHSSDGRPESRRPDPATLTVERHLDDHQARADWVEPTAVQSMAEMKSAGRTLCPVWVTAVEDLVVKEVSPEWEPWQKAKLEEEGLFAKNLPLKKIPFEFRFVWRDRGNERHDSLFIAWEVGETWRQYQEQYPDPIPRLRDAFLKRCADSNRLAFFMGNFKQHPQHYGVCGIYAPPRGKVTDGPRLFG